MDPPSTASVYSFSDIPLLDTLFDVQKLSQHIGRTESAETSYNNELSITDSSHPVMVMVRKVADLAAARRDQVSGSVFYASVIRFLYTVCQSFPSVYLSTVIGALDYLDRPTPSFYTPTGAPSCLLLLPLELLDRIFSHVSWGNLLRSRVTCRRWCQVATRFTHAHLVLRLSPDWQVAIVNAGGLASLMDEYALAQYMAMTYFVVYWGIAPYVLSVSYMNWPCLRVCFFYHLLPNVKEFVCMSDGCSHRNVSTVSTPFMLPPSIDTVRLVKCSMQYHSIERMLRSLECLHTLELRGVLHGHVPLPEYNEEHGYRLALWRHDNLPPAALSHLPPSTLRHLILDFPADDVHPITWLPSSNHPYNRLYAQIFQSKDLTEALTIRRVRDGMFPIRLHFDRITSMEIVVGRTMLPTQTDMWSVLTSLVTLKVLICKKNPQYLSEINVTLQPLAMLKHLTVVFSIRDTARALRTASTWSSRRRSDLDSTLALVFMFDKSSRGTLPNYLDRQAMPSVIEGTGSSSRVSFKGKMRLDLVGDRESFVSGTDKMYARSVASYVGMDTTVLLDGEVEG
ncbi:uncharacterized protein ARMOST_12226 [Armillaria ostoyae]|uniref:F-box domain-containing protein n=1 Tax=Armillaria ostoyae TaxID=47428 RepID=A0A284RJF0_ARMOS|nr:uncharacterized protein ARMOST_12226 [Armillaria ostoyae]